MKTRTSLNREVVSAIVVSILALGLLLSSWFDALSKASDGLILHDGLVALLLTAAIVTTHKLPIRFRPYTEIDLDSVPLYLMIVLLPVSLALLAIGVGICLGRILARQARGGLITDIGIVTARWMIVGFCAAQVAHLSVSEQVGSNLLLFATALVLFAGDMLTGSLHVALISRGSFWRIFVANLREVGAIEASQYFIGILGAIAAEHEIWSLVLLALPTAFAYFAFKQVKEMQARTARLVGVMKALSENRMQFESRT